MTAQDFPILILDTTIRGAFAAVVNCQSDIKKNEILSFCHRSVNRAAAAGVSDLVSEVLRGSQLSWNDIQLFTVGHGPGSFTGIKIGLAFAYGVKRARPELALCGSSALSALAEMRPGRIWFLPATRSQGYASFSEKGEPAQEWIVDLKPKEKEDSEITLLNADDRKPFDWRSLGELKLESVLPWPLLESLAAQHSLAISSQWQLSGLCTEIAMGMAVSVFQRWPIEVNQTLLPQPQYLRRSAPEEALAAKKGAST